MHLGFIWLRVQALLARVNDGFSGAREERAFLAKLNSLALTGLARTVPIEKLVSGNEHWRVSASGASQRDDRGKPAFSSSLDYVLSLDGTPLSS